MNLHYEASYPLPELALRQIEQRIRHVSLGKLIACTLLVMISVLAVIRLVAPSQESRYIPAVIGLVLLVANWFLVARGYTSAASALYFGLMILLIAVAMVLNGGMRAPAYMAVYTLIGAVGLLYSSWIAFALWLCTVVFAAIIVGLQSNGLLREIEPPPLTLYWFIASVSGGLLLLAVIIPNRLLREALLESEARRAEAERAQRLLLDRKKALRESEARLRRVMEATNDAIWDWHTNEGRLHVSQRWYEMLGYKPDEVTLDHETLRRMIHPDDAARVDAALEAIMRDGALFDEQFRLRRADGSWCWVHSRGRATENDHNGRPVRFSGANTDVTERMASAAERENLEVRLRQSEKMEALGRMAGGVSHDFNNLLTAILWNCESLLTCVSNDDRVNTPEGQSETLQSGLTQIKSASQQAAVLTRQLLTFCRREVAEPEYLQPNKLLEGLGVILRRVIRENVVLEMNLGASSGRVYADPGQIEQIVLNLVVNAADAMPGGGTIQFFADEVGHGSRSSSAESHTGAEGRCIRLRVKDDGIGMDKETIKHIFEPFFTTKPMAQGTGLGLATVYGAVSQMKGHIDVESSPGRGSTFTVYVPCVVPPAETTNEPSAVSTSATGESILVCEDEDIVRRAMTGTLREAGYAVTDAANGTDALRVADQAGAGIDILITDLIMPGMSGIEVARQLKSRIPRLRVLYVSGYPSDCFDTEDLTGARSSYLPKPFEPAVLLKRVREVLNTR